MPTPLRWLGRCAYPLLITVLVALAWLTLGLDWEPSLPSMLFLLWTVLFLGLLERLIPYDRSWHPDRSEWRWYGAYFFITAVGGSIAQGLVSAAVAVLAEPQPVLPLAAEIPLAVLAGALAGYAVHRLGHTNPWLWRLHGVHHVPEKVNVANNGVNHVLDVAFSQGATQLALAGAGFSQDSVFVAGLFVVAQGYFVHANIDVRLGWLNHVVSSPEQHRLHHSTDLAEAGHYAVDLSVLDHLFGSFTWRPGRRPGAVGLHDPRSFPPTGALLATLVHPWRRRTRRPARR
ncbi:sterol desaturase family protein [Streptomyces avicenniae]|uniref:sterol desaturase family protein n=1 Tax=Streptomyces avicenniae TaxID=500153 RepID=UPI001CBA5F39|nr:sterol desaturase family protein [Streptomyces avicenniae]